MPGPLKAQATSNPRKSANSRELVSTGSKDVFKHRRQRDDQREERPSTTRALILRNGKYGARGTGEVFLMSRMTGGEKLVLLAEDLAKKMSKSLIAPFRLEQSIRLAESQLSENLDDIANLKDPELFSSLIAEELKAHASDNEKPNGGQNSSRTAQVVSDRIHNAYMLASAWKIAMDSLLELQAEGLRDELVVQQLKINVELRTRYLVLYDLVNVLVDLNQRKFSVLATTTPHYKRYFKEVDNEAGETEFIFDWNQVRAACTSFLDSIIIELCFPRAPYPKAVLYQILHDAIDEAPNEAKRFPQALWDTVGNLSMSVQLQQILETPLLAADAKSWKDVARKMPGPYDQWVDAQLWSGIASEKYANFKDTIFPLSKTQDREVLVNMWKTINMNYKLVSGKDIDDLWQLTEILQPTAQWHPRDLATTKDDGDDIAEYHPPLPGGKKFLAITNGSDSDDSMPPLQDVSDSDESSVWDGSEYDDDDSENGQSEYDTDEEDEIRDLVREAMDAVHTSDWATPDDDPRAPKPFSDEDRKGNPFLNLLGSLRGRMFSKSAKLKTTTTSLPSQPSSAIAAESKASSNIPSQGARSKSQKTTIEEVVDEDEAAHATKQKKKSKKKKKKAVVPDGGVSAPPPAVTSPPQDSGRPTPTVTSRTNEYPKASPSPAKPKVVDSASPQPAAGSFSIPLERVTTAQSARSYLQSEHLGAPKAKVKSRPGHASMFSPLLQRFGLGKDTKETPQEQKEKRSKFANLSKRTKDCLHQILRTADDTKGSKGMKWKTFAKTLEDLGFKCDPSTAGSSVRFDPPDGRDRAISFHKPHPDTTIDHIKLKEWSKKLKTYYGWEPEDLMEAAQA